jgi:hypothetical protein
MGAIRDAAAAAFRDFNVSGVPASGAFDPVKSGVRNSFGVVEDRIDAIEGVATVGVRWAPETIKVRSIGNVDLASELQNGDILNGVALATGDHVLLPLQANPAQNGIYTVVAAGAAGRADFANTPLELAGIGVLVASGDIGSGERWVLSMAADAINLGATALKFSRVGIEFDLGGVGDNTWVGTDALSDNVAGVGNVALGLEALRDTTVSQNTGIGATALRAATTGARNTAVGSASTRALLTGSDNVAIGAGAGLARTTGDDNVIVGANAMNNHAGGGDQNVAVGGATLTEYTGSEATAVGYQGLASTTGVRNTAVGAYSGAAVTTGQLNTFVGYGAGSGGGGQLATVNNSTAIGAGARSTRDNQISLGDVAVAELLFGQESFLKTNHLNSTFYLGLNAGNRTSTGQACIGIGDRVLTLHEGGGHLVAIGQGAMEDAVDAGSVVALGSYACRAAGSTGLFRDVVAVGFDTFRHATEGVGGTAVGHMALQNCTAVGNNTGLGDSALRYTTTGSQNVAVGYVTMDRNTTGNENVAVGNGAGVYRATGNQNVHIGHSCNAGDEVAGTGGFAGGNRNVAAGYQAVFRHTGNDCVAIGADAGRSLTTASNSTFLGSNAGDNALQKVDAQNSMALGANTHTTKNNQVVIGDANVTEFVLAGVTVTKAQLVALLALL